MSTPIPSMPRGIDVSKFQQRVNWSAVRVSGVSFAFARAIDDRTGTTADPFFSQNFRGMRDAGLLRGAYHFFNPRRNARAAANLFVSIVGSLGPGDLQPVIDVESDGSRRDSRGRIITPGVPANVILDGVAEWIDVVQAALGRQVIIYTFTPFWRDTLGNSRRFSSHPLWIAHLREVPVIPSAFPTFAFHQHSFTGRVPGVNGDVDLDRFNGSMNGLRAFANLPPIDGGSRLSLDQPLTVASTRSTTKRAAPGKSAKKRGQTVKAGAKKKATKKGTAKKGAGGKAAAKRGTKKQSSTRKGSSKRATKRASKKAR